ncbi:hypothetical protein K3G63_21970 [Hymenobacter sp. HSC-4F20]|uniref:hypothetical protein n=1 Tax=Hymenobacter sp. HSC-4F20 TaxID=2864135 RepID=UPI001C73ABA5|nr:hypothetical protein [Hymenobacter sp. HSC-4F20]MBX0293128.1 hypothetical protein [Hymenobacter sp. HSC-4F20]
MFKQLGSLEITVPTLLFLIYLTGFLCLNAHLHPYGLYETNALSFSYVKAGALFLLYNSSLAALTHLVHQEQHKTPLWEYGFNILLAAVLSVEVGAAAIYLYDTVTITSFPFNITAEHPWVAGIVTGANITMLICIVNLSDGEEITSKDNKLLWALFFSLIITVILLTYFEKSILLSLAAYHTIAIGGFLLLVADVRSVLKDPEDSIGSVIPTFALVLLFASLAFGKLVYPLVSVAVGGGKPYASRLYLTPMEQKALIQSHLLPSATRLDKPVFILYQTEKTVYVRLGQKTVGIAADGIKAYEAIP